MIGKTLGDRYKVTGWIGSGAMGDVYLAEHVILRKKIAVKVLKHELCKHEELVQRFQQEAIAASRIGHENIVSVTDFGRTDEGALYFVMEALEGESLGALVHREGALELSRGLQLLLQLCRALAAAHANGIVHRDLKLDNLVLVRRDDGSELLKVLDFGISKVTDLADSPAKKHTTQAGALLGTPDYMSPEQIRGEDVDHRADVYAFGVLAFELITGALPFEARSVADVMMKHLGEQPIAPSQRRPELKLPAVFDALVLRALEKDRALRFQSMVELRAALGRCLEAVGVGPALTPPPRVIPLRVAAPPLEPAPPAPGRIEDTFTPPDPALVKAEVERARTARGLSRSRFGPVLVGLLLLAASAAGAWQVLGRAPAPVLPVPVVAPVVPAPVVAPPVEPPPVIAAPTPEPAPPPVVKRPAAPVLGRLEGKDVARVFGQSQGRLRKCLQDQRSLLPGTSGRLELSFTILDSGAVSAASLKTPLHPTITDCVVARIKELRFPRHLQPTQTFDLPLDYALKE